MALMFGLSNNKTYTETYYLPVSRSTKKWKIVNIGREEWTQFTESNPDKNSHFRNHIS